MHINRIINLVLLVILITFISCTSKEPGGYLINGKIAGASDSTDIKLYSIDLKEIIDSARVGEDGTFTMAGSVDHPTTCFLQCGPQYAVIQLENTSFQVDAELENMKENAEISGGKEQIILNNIEQAQRAVNRELMTTIDSLNNGLYRDDEEKQWLIQKYHYALESQTRIYVDGGLRNFDTWYGSKIVYQQRQNIDRDTIKNLLKGLPGDFKKTDYMLALEVYLSMKTISVGNRYIDFDAEDIEGNPFSLSSLEGNYIYLTFWRSDCGYCRLENKLLSEKFSELPENLKLVHFSTDRNRDMWLKANKADDIKWVSVSDLMGETGIIKTRYEVVGTPVSYLINPDGEVLKKFLGYDETLIDKIKKEVSESNI